MKVTDYEKECYTKCNFGDKRLTERALYIQDHLRVKYGQPLSKVFNNASDLKRTYEFLANSKTSFQLVVEPSHYQTANHVKNLPIILSVGDTSFLDYKKIKLKREEYGPTGNGGNGLILQTSLLENWFADVIRDSKLKTYLWLKNPKTSKKLKN
jgi:hypothetical protein